MPEKRMEIANFAQTEIRGLSFVSFDVAMNGHVISTVDAPILSGRIVWTHAAIHGFGDFDGFDRSLLEAEIDRAFGEHDAGKPARAARH